MKIVPGSGDRRDASARGRLRDSDLRKRGQHRAARAGAGVGDPNSEPAQRSLGIAYFKANRLRRSPRSAAASGVDGARGRRRRRSTSASPPRRRTIFPRRERPTSRTSRSAKRAA